MIVLRRSLCLVLILLSASEISAQEVSQETDSGRLAAIRESVSAGRREAAARAIERLLEEEGLSAAELREVSELAAAGDLPDLQVAVLLARARLSAIDASEAWLDVADAHLQHGRLEEAVEASQHAVAQVAGLPPRDRALVMANLGRCMIEAGQAEGAVRALEQAIRDLGTDVDVEVRAACAQNLSAALVLVGDLQRARRVLVAAWQGLDPARPSRVLADLNMNLADIAGRMGDHDEAVDRARAGLGILSTIGAPDRDRLAATSDYAAYLERRSWTTGSAADALLAEQLLLAASESAQRAWPVETFDSVRLRIEKNLSTILWRRGSVDDALERSKTILMATQDGGRLPLDARPAVYMGHASLLASTGSMPQARNYMRRAVLAAVERVRLGELGSERARSHLHHTLRDVVSSQLSCRDQGSTDPASDREDLESWLFARSLENDRFRRAHALASRGGVDPEAKKLIVHIRQLVRRAVRAGEALEQERTMIEVDAAQSRLATLVPEVQYRPSSLAGITEAMASDMAIAVTAHYMRAPMAREGVRTEPAKEHVCVFLLLPGGAVERIEVGEAGQLALAAREFRARCVVSASMSRGVGVEGVTPSSDADIASLLAPLFAKLPAATRRFVVCPDGALASVPWALMPVGKDRILGESLTISYVDHPSNLTVDQATDSPASLLVVGGIDFGAAATGSQTELWKSSWPALPATLAEIEVARSTFRRKFPEVDEHKLSGDVVSRNVLADALPGKKYVHIATHGYTRDDLFGLGGKEVNAGSFDDSRLRTCGLVLSQANTGDLGSFVSAAELSCLDLTQCELVVLATCSSNHGSRVFGESLAGLHSAVRAAGARSVISTLWPIPDGETARFFTYFYEALFEARATPYGAFQHAVGKARAAGAAPACWAAFVYYGPV